MQLTYSVLQYLIFNKIQICNLMNLQAHFIFGNLLQN